MSVFLSTFLCSIYRHSRWCRIAPLNFFIIGLGLNFDRLSTLTLPLLLHALNSYKLISLNQTIVIRVCMKTLALLFKMFLLLAAMNYNGSG